MSPKCYLLKNIVNFRGDFVLSHWEQNVFIWYQSLKLNVSRIEKEEMEIGRNQYKRALGREWCLGGETINNLYLMIQTAPVPPLQSPHQTGGNESFNPSLDINTVVGRWAAFLTSAGRQGSCLQPSVKAARPQVTDLWQNCRFHLCTWENLAYLC